MKKQLSAILLILVLAAGILLLLYPTVSNWWNRKVQTRAVASYKEAAEQLSEQDYSEIFEKAESYNIQLRRIGMNRFSHPELVSGYENILNITGTGIMGYVTIDKLDTELPIYHGTDPGVLQIAAGHLEGSSLPIGGKGNHSVISAATGDFQVPDCLQIWMKWKKGEYFYYHSTGPDADLSGGSDTGSGSG